jgi:hypothetical protein
MSLALDRPQTSWIMDAARSDGKGARLVARTLFREMQRSGFTHEQVLAVADELLGCLCATVRSGEETVAPASALADWEPEGTGD